jgi:hypothetical protein
MAFPDPDDPGYKRYFVKMSQPGIPLEEVPTRPEHLRIPISGTIQFVVEHVSSMVLSMPKSSNLGTLGRYPFP